MSFPFINPSIVLENVKRGVDRGVEFIQCRCPACAAEGGDATGKNHLRIYKTGAFTCAKYQKEGGEPTDHNRVIRRLIRVAGDNDAAAEVVFIDPDPSIELDKVFPESTLSDLLPDHSYWEDKRHIPADVVAKLGGGLAPATAKGKLSGRYIFPIRSPNGSIMGFSGRLVSDNSFAPNWKHLFRSSRACYPYQLAVPAIKQTRRVIFVESIGDLLALHSVGLYNVLVLFGLVMHPRIISTLVATNPERIVLATNNDKDFGETERKQTKAGGNKAAEKACRRLEAFFNPDKIVMRLPEFGNDWNATTAEELETFRKEMET